MTTNNNSLLREDLADMFAGPEPQRWTSHFARCPAASTFRKK